MKNKELINLEDRNMNKKFGYNKPVGAINLAFILLISGLLVISTILPAISTAVDADMNDLFPLTSYSIYGSATWNGGSKADNASVEVVSYFGVISTIVGPTGGWGSGVWQVDCGSPGPGWPDGTDFTVFINGTGNHTGWLGSATGTVIFSEYYVNMGNIVVYPGNYPPIAVNDTDDTLEDTAVIIDVLDNDYDNDGTINHTTVSIINDVAHGDTSINPVTGNVTYMPDGNYNGFDSFTYSVDDNEGATSNSATVNLIVTPVNDPPVLDPIGSQSVTEGTILTFTATATDIDLPAQLLTYSLESGVPSGAEITSDSIFTWTPTDIQSPGIYTFDVVVKDEDLAEDRETIEITVNEANIPPVLDLIGPQSADELTLISFTANATDADNPAQIMTFNLDGSVPSGAEITSDGVFTWIPSEIQGPDVYSFDVVVNDTFDEDRETIEVTVGEVNVAPVLDSVGPQAILEESLLTFTATASDVDVPVQTLTFSLVDGVSGSVPSGASITSGGLFTWMPNITQSPDVYIFDVVVTDGIDEDRETITVTVDEVNISPIFSSELPIDGDYGVSIDMSQLSIFIEDPEGDLLDWSIQTSPDIGNSSGSGNFNNTQICNVVGLEYSTDYEWFVNATDGNDWTRVVYSFSTESAPVNNLIVFSNINPVDGAVIYQGIPPL